MKLAAPLGIGCNGKVYGVQRLVVPIKVGGWGLDVLGC